MKLDTELVRNVDGDAYKANIAVKLLELARGLGISTIAEGVETRPEWRWLAEHDCDYVQGFFFARPASPPELLGLSSAPPEVSRKALPSPRAPARALPPFEKPPPLEKLPPFEKPPSLEKLPPFEKPPSLAASAELAPPPDRDEEVRLLREKVGELVMEVERLRRSLSRAPRAGDGDRGACVEAAGGRPLL